MAMVIRRNDPVAQLALPPGFRFHPTDQELIVYYLMKKATGQPFAMSIIADIDLYKYNPWDLPDGIYREVTHKGKEWYFFSPRNRKYPNGFRPNRSAENGYWKATGTDKPIFSETGTKIGIKKALVFYIGKAPRGTKTDWIMHEYRLPDGSSDASSSRGSKGKTCENLRMDEWVLCRLYKKTPGVLKAEAAAAAAGKKPEESGSCMQEQQVTHPQSGSCIREQHATHPQINHNKFNSSTPQSITSLQQLWDQDNGNWMEFGDSPMADKLSRCGTDQANMDCTAWNNNKNLVIPRNMMAFVQKESQNSNTNSVIPSNMIAFQHSNTNSVIPMNMIEFVQKESQQSNGVITEVGFSRYPFERPPKPPVSAPTNVDRLQYSSFKEQPYNETFGASPLVPGMEWVGHPMLVKQKGESHCYWPHNLPYN